MVDVAGCQNDRVQSAVYAPNALLTMPSTTMLTTPSRSCLAVSCELLPIGWIPMALKYTHLVLFSSYTTQFVLQV
jgi:hypothetical protein